MTSSELIALKKKYLVLKESLEVIISETLKAFNKLSGSDIIIAESYSVNDVSVDGGYIKKSINTVSDAYNEFKATLVDVNNKIASLDRDIEHAKDEELAKYVAGLGK